MTAIPPTSLPPTSLPPSHPHACPRCDLDGQPKFTAHVGTRTYGDIVTFHEPVTGKLHIHMPAKSRIMQCTDGHTWGVALTPAMCKTDPENCTIPTPSLYCKEMKDLSDEDVAAIAKEKAQRATQDARRAEKLAKAQADMDARRAAKVAKARALREGGLKPGDPGYLPNISLEDLQKAHVARMDITRIKPSDPMFREDEVETQVMDAGMVAALDKDMGIEAESKEAEGKEAEGKGKEPERSLEDDLLSV